MQGVWLLRNRENPLRRFAHARGVVATQPNSL